jgi:L-2-hydroxyglutarate oxidase LhgO
MPLVMQRRPENQPVAATRVAYGTDVNFGALTRQLVAALQQQPNFNLLCEHQVQALKATDHKRWRVGMMDSNTSRKITMEASFVFLGAGGGALRGHGPAAQLLNGRDAQNQTKSPALGRPRRRAGPAAAAGLG